MARVVERRSSRYLLMVLVVAHLAWISRQVDTLSRQPDAFGRGADPRRAGSFLTRGVYAVFSPVQRAVAAVAHGIHSTWYGYVDLRGARAENEDLRARMAALESQVTTYRNDARESERLREILDIQKAMPMKSVVARIQARDALPWFRVVTIDKGRRHGVALNAPVVCPAGVVGRVIELGDDAAKVQVLLDQGSGIGVVSERSRATGVVSGPIGSRDDLPPDERGALDRALDVASRRDLAMKYVSAVSDIAVGDAVVTSGFDQLYPKGLMVGRVSYVGPPSGLFKEVRVTPSARPDALEEVMVLETPQAKAVSNPERVK